MMSNISIPNKKFQLTFFSLSFFSYATFREEDKNIFDYCRENNIDRVSEAISSQKVDVNTKDEEVPMKPESRNMSCIPQRTGCRREMIHHKGVNENTRREGVNRVQENRRSIILLTQK